MQDGRRGKCADRLGSRVLVKVGDKRNNDKLDSDKRSTSRSNDDVKVLPCRQWCIHKLRSNPFLYRRANIRGESALQLAHPRNLRHPRLTDGILVLGLGSVQRPIDPAQALGSSKDRQSLEKTEPDGLPCRG